jgi:hypothetical protein
MKPSLALTRSLLLSGLCLSSFAYAGNGNGNGNSSSSSGSSSSGGSVNTDPSIPVGALVVSPSVVQTGTKPSLTWDIMFPQTLGDVLHITPPGKLTLLDQGYIDVQIIGSSVTTCASGQAASTANYPTDARMSVNGGSYAQLFYGTSADVNPSKILYSKKLNKGTVINFGGRYANNNVWSSFFTGSSANMQVVALANGDVPPTSFALDKSATLANFLKPYLDSSGKVVLGPLSVLIMMELGQTDRSESCFDLQDQVLLVTFRAKNNNGHGNNLDGVDSSNPGNGKGGPNGAVDPSGGVDDEGK